MKRVFRGNYACVFPAAIKPWQKALCAATGVVGLCGTLYGIGKAAGYALDAIDTADQRQRQRQEPVTPDDKGVLKYPLEYYATRNQLADAYLNLFAPPCVIPFMGGVVYWCGYRVPFEMWKEGSLALKKFIGIFRGTECCSMVRATAGFCVVAPVAGVVFCSCLAAAWVLILSLPQAVQLTYQWSPREDMQEIKQLHQKLRTFEKQ